jgi:hypothetical protein
VAGSVLVGEPHLLPQRATTWAAVGYLVVVGSVVVFVLYLVVLRYWAASRAAYGFVVSGDRSRPGASGVLLSCCYCWEEASRRQDGSGCLLVCQPQAGLVVGHDQTGQREVFGQRGLALCFGANQPIPGRIINSIHGRH